MIASNWCSTSDYDFAPSLPKKVHFSPRLVWCTYKHSIYTSDLFLNDQRFESRSYVADFDGFVGSERRFFVHTNGTAIQMHHFNSNFDEVIKFFTPIEIVAFTQRVDVNCMT